MSENKEVNYAELWVQTLSQIKDSLSATEYESWFSRLNFGYVQEDKIVLNVPSLYFRDRFSETYKRLIEKTISNLSHKNFRVEFEIKKSTEKKISEEKPAETVKTKEEKEIKPNTILNPAYTFDAFVPGDNSNFAYNAALAIAKNPGSTFNPCLIYGGVGLGKTHLIQSIGNYILNENPKAKVLYVTAENFTNEFIQTYASAENRQKFKNKYRKASVLLVDDIHFLQKKESVQEELFNTFNDLYDTERQLVFTCDRPIEELRDISERLKSRFERGLNIDLLPPDYETRVAILNKKCMDKKFIISNEVINYIAENISSNVRALESCLTRLIAYSSLLHKEITLETAKEQLKQIIFSNSNDNTGISIDQIIRVVSGYFKVSPYDIKGKAKNQSIVFPRQIAMYLCRTLTDYSTTEIGASFEGKNHSTVMYNAQKIESLIRTNEKDINNIIDRITKQIKSELKNN